MRSSTIKSELLNIAAKNDGILQPIAVLQWAERHPESALHKSIAWDDAKAAHEYRLSQVRHLIAVHIVDQSGERQMVSLRIDRVETGGGYRHLDSVLADKTMREMLLADAFADLERVRLRFEHLTELAGVWAAVRKAKRKKRSRRSEAEHRPA